MRCSLRPLDASPGPRPAPNSIEQVGSKDLLVLSTDFPHWQSDTSAEALRKIEPPDGSGARVLAQNTHSLQTARLRRTGPSHLPEAP